MSTMYKMLYNKTAKARRQEWEIPLVLKCAGFDSLFVMHSKKFRDAEVSQTLLKEVELNFCAQYMSKW